VGGDDHVGETVERASEHAAEVRRRLVAQRVQLGEPLGLGQVGDLVDVQVVVQHHARAREIAEAPVRPAVVPDHRRPLGERDHAGDRHPEEPLRAGAELANVPPHRMDPAAIVVVVAEHEVDRPGDLELEDLQVLLDGGRLRDVPRDEDGVGRDGGDLVAEPSNLIALEEVQVDVRTPRELHGLHVLYPRAP
jgi:hypothetical protein